MSKKTKKQGKVRVIDAARVNSGEIKVPVTMRALVQRINRALAKNDERLQKRRSDRDIGTLGEWFIVGTKIGAVVHRDVNLEALGRELGVLDLWERLAEDGEETPPLAWAYRNRRRGGKTNQERLDASQRTPKGRLPVGQR